MQAGSKVDSDPCFLTSPPFEEANLPVSRSPPWRGWAQGPIPNTPQARHARLIVSTLDGEHYEASVTRRTKRLWPDEEKRLICFPTTDGPSLQWTPLLSL